MWSHCQFAIFRLYLQSKKQAALIHPQADSEANESALDQTQHLLQQISQLTEAVAARDTFIAVAGHELRNPMMPILGQLDSLVSAVLVHRCSHTQLVQRLTRIQQAVHQYMKRAVVLLDVSRITSGNFRLEPSPCDLTIVFRQIVDEFGAAALHIGTVITLDAPDELVGSWDRLAVEQVVDNLLSNAIKYGNRTPVELRARHVGDHLEIRVRDHGKGIPSHERTRIFERFERAVRQNEHRTGFGVGLWVVGQLVDAMKGTIEIDDTPGGGTQFIVNLPWVAA